MTSTMISRNEFPYLQQLVINDAYAVKNLTIPVFEAGNEFKHLILTGKNGSGKTTVLSELYHEMIGNPKPAKMRQSLELGVILADKNETKEEYKNMLRDISKVVPIFSSAIESNLIEAPSRSEAIMPFFEAFRQMQVKDVRGVANNQKLDDQIRDVNNKNQVSELFKQYLVNKKISQAFAVIKGDKKMVNLNDVFFNNLDMLFSRILGDENVKLEFYSDDFEFFFVYSDGRRVTFNQLSAGFSSFIGILNDLLMRTDLLRRQANDYTYNPCGFVLIDEPETHLHLEMQYQILPLLTNLFPNLQFIVATHSPAVASSITNATVFDLSSGKMAGDEAAGSSFSELMQTHFGVENEYSNVADGILEQIDMISALADRSEALRQLQKLFEEKGRYMSPVLKLDVQAQLRRLEREQAA
ncbi:AAA family ATPase [Hymenobacter sp. B81]|uniref:AAA family ATPase n=1 Tax=Hymenobacter sp. B81 TaxID=3344878 RepID=UPI0037DDBA8C